MSSFHLDLKRTYVPRRFERIEESMIKFIHAADLHLDSPFSGLKSLPKKIVEMIQQSTFQSLATIVYSAIHNQVDFVVFSGDIYDLEDRSVKAQVQFKKEMERLNKAKIPVYIIHGNHDFIGDEKLHLSLPENVKVFDTSVETVRMTTKGGESVAVSGFSYGERWITERMITDYPKRHTQIDFHIGLLHGFQEGINSEHARYAPFTLDELKEKGYDYWALGHIHVRSKVSDFPLAYYPGNIQGRNKKETGEKGYLMVELKKNASAEIEFYSSASIVWEKVVVDAVKLNDMDAIYKLIQESLPSIESAQFHYLISLELQVSEDIKDTLLKKISQDQFIEAHHFFEDAQFIWIANYKVSQIKSNHNDSDLQSLFPEAFQEVLSELSEEEGFNELTTDFFDQSKFSRILEERSVTYREEMIREALSELRNQSI